MTWIQTYGGVRFDLEHPTPDMVKLEDIAHALALVNRFTGHTSKPYSVAQHSLYVSALCEADGGGGARMGLFHDAAEAYVGDVSRPLKRLIGGLYVPIETRVMRAVSEQFVLIPFENTSLCDALALAWEATNLLPGGIQHDWQWLPPTPTLHNPYAELTWQEAESAFLARAEELGVRP